MTVSNEKANHTDASPGTPIGVMIVSLGLVVYGLLWAGSGFLTLYASTDPTVTGMLAPMVGFTLVLLAHGIWKRNWVAWTLTVLLFMLIIWWKTLQISTLSLDSFPILPLVIVFYLMFQQDLYFQSSTDSKTEAVNS